jgi:hypothetical protein
MDLKTMSREQLEAMVKRMAEEKAHKLSIKHSPKGAVSVYGLGRFPVSLYPSQWESLLANASRVTDYLKLNATELNRLNELSKAAKELGKEQAIG